MTPTPRTKFLMAVLATGILAVGAIALSVEARPGDGPGSQPPRPHDGSNQTAERRDIQQDRRDIRQDRKDLRQDRRELRDDIKEFCAKTAANSTAAKRCEHLKDAVKARRVAFGLLTAIRVHERELGRIDFRIDIVKEKLASGNLTANQTAKDNTLLAHLQERHAKVVQLIKDEQAKLASLRDRWSEVKDHLKDREQKGEDDGGVPADGGAPAEPSDTETSSGTNSTAAA